MPIQLGKNLSIRSKLLVIILGTTIAALLVGFVLMVWYGVLIFKRDMVAHTRAMARVVSSYSEAELAFLDSDTAAATLAKLQVIPDLVHASLYDRQGQLFAAYPADEVQGYDPPELGETGGHEFIGKQLHVVEPIVTEGELCGTLHICVSTTGLEHKIAQYLSVIALLVGGLIAIASLAAVKLQGLISGPILQLAGAALRISKDGDYSTRVVKAGNDEVGTLYEAWNQMLEQIELRQRELERSNRELDQFAYAVSHDLRAPLRAIANLSSWIEEDMGEAMSDETRHQMDLLRGRVDRLEGLINGILEYSRVGRVATAVAQVNVRELIRTVVDDLAPPSGFSIHISEELPTLPAHEVLLAQVFGNLISNAVKHHDRPDGRIGITAEERGDFWEFAVRDDGPGIATEYHEKIFMMFQTLQPRDHFESTGVGLALVKKIVEDQEGDLAVESQEGLGAVFRFSWPKRPVSPDQTMRGRA